jgi:hypothetical protein
VTREILVLALRGLAGGLFVVLFALVSEVVKPKEFAGLFCAAPSVAIASLIITVIDKGAARAAENLSGMVLGALAMTLYCLVGVYTVRALRAKAGALAAGPAWFAAALGGYVLVFR